MTETETEEALEKAHAKVREALKVLGQLMPAVSEAASLFAQAECSADTVTLGATFEAIEKLISRLEPELRALS